MDPLNVVGENAELQHEQSVEKRELDWLKTRVSTGRYDALRL